MLEYNFKSYSIKDENVIHMVTLTDWIWFTPILEMFCDKDVLKIFAKL